MLSSVTVRLGNEMITRELSDVSFRSTCPGGYASATLSLRRPIDEHYENLEPRTPLIIYDTMTADVCWQGWLEEPGRSEGSDGGVWEIVAVGPSAHAEERSEALIYCDESLDGWEPAQRTLSHIEASVSSRPGTETNPPMGLFVRFPRDLTVDTNDLGAMAYKRLQNSTQRLARVRADWIGGVTSGIMRLDLVTRFADGTGGSADDTVGLNPTGGVLAAYYGNPSGPAIPSTNRGWAEFRMVHTGTATTLANQGYWVHFSNPTIRTILLDQTGAERAAADYNVNNIDPQDVVMDLLGRLLDQYDGPNALIETTTQDIDQMAYADPVSCREVLDDVMRVVPEFYWAAWEGSPARFEWRRWPTTTVRYDVSTRDGFQAPQSAGEIYNRVIVRFRDKFGRSRAKAVTNYVPVLDDNGITRDAEPIDLGDEFGSEGMATLIGNGFLAEHATPGNAGTVTVARSIYDFEQGRVVEPHQVLPGGLVRVRGVNPYPDALNPSDQDGDAVMRAVATEYRAADNTVTIEMGSPARTLEQIVADSLRRRRRKR